jgi:tRNA-dependent cyclodipeptide synthase
MSDEASYIVRVKSGAGWRRFSRMRLMISVGKNYHEGSKLLAVVNWINRNPEIEEVQVSVNDYLQRHNLVAFGTGEQEAGSLATYEGTAWIERNEENLRAVNVPLSFTRWEEWYGTSEYREAHSALLSLTNHDATFKETVEADASSLAERRARRGEVVPPRLIDCSRDYVLEELAVFALQSRVFPAVEVYPGTSLLSVTYLRGKVLSDALSPLSTRHVTRIDFDRVKESNVICRDIVRRADV